MDNPDMDLDMLDMVLTKLRSIGNLLIGVIELSEDRKIDIVTDIFNRINSKGTTLSQGDIVMSKIAAAEDYGGNMVRKTIVYFARLRVEPSFYYYIKEQDTGGEQMMLVVGAETAEAPDPESKFLDPVCKTGGFLRNREA